MLRRPIPDAYVAMGGAVAAGAYPGSPRSAGRDAATAKLAAFLNAGVTAFIDLTGAADRLEPYAVSLQEIAMARDVTITHQRFHIPDMDVCDARQLNLILDTIDDHVSAGNGVYVHCWGGVGRTGMVIGCWLVRHGYDGDSALQEVLALFRSMSEEKWAKHKSWGSPQTEAQRQVVRGWVRRDSRRLAEQAPDAVPSSSSSNSTDAQTAVWELLRPRADVEPVTRDRMRGALIGLAVGDALGTTVEFKRPGTFPPVTDMTGGGPFGLNAGDWTDDTSMALCLAESLIERREFDAHDQMTRYTRWQREGHLSSTGTCFDIGRTVATALRAFVKTGDPFSGPVHEQSAGNGSLMRLAPIPLFYSFRGDDAIAFAGESSRTTHGAPVAIDACRYLAALIVGAVRGATKEALCSAHYAPTPGYWDEQPLDPVIAAIANGSFKHKSPPAICGTGYAADSLEAALWAFYHATDFRDGCLMAVNLGDDADTTAAVYGQLAGAYFGESGIPREWRERLTHKALIDRYAETLFQLGFGGASALGDVGVHAREQAEQLLRAAGNDAARALRQMDEDIATAKREMGVMAYYMNGSVHDQAMTEETRFLLRVALGMSLLRGDA